MTPSAADFSTTPYVEKHQYRGRLFTITELDIAEYDRKVAEATTKDEDTGVETVDQQTLIKLLVLACVDITPREYARTGTRVILALNRAVNNMHYGVEPDELKKGADDTTSDEAVKDDAAPNA